MRHKKGEWFEVYFVYEKLINFCFICGMLDHTKRFGRSLLDRKDKPIMRKFDPELRASFSRNNNFIGVRWLREGSRLPKGGGLSFERSANLGEFHSNKSYHNNLFEEENRRNLNATNQFANAHPDIEGVEVNTKKDGLIVNDMKRKRVMPKNVWPKDGNG